MKKGHHLFQIVSFFDLSLLASVNKVSILNAFKGLLYRHTPSLSEGFVTASLLFCVGAMAIMGALDSGLTGDHSTLYAKALLDGIISVVYASTLGIGVALSAIPIFIYQGTIALGASFLAPYLTESVILEMKCVGSILILGLSLNMLGLTKIKVMNYVPAVFLPILLCQFL